MSPAGSATGGVTGGGAGVSTTVVTCLSALLDVSLSDPRWYCHMTMAPTARPPATRPPSTSQRVRETGSCRRTELLGRSGFVCTEEPTVMGTSIDGAGA